MNLMDGLFENIQNARNPVELNSSSNTPTFWLVLAPDVGARIALQWIYCQGRYASHGDGSPVLTSQVWFHWYRYRRYMAIAHMFSCHTQRISKNTPTKKNRVPAKISGKITSVYQFEGPPSHLFWCGTNAQWKILGDHPRHGFWQWKGQWWNNRGDEEVKSVTFTNNQP